LKFTTAWAQKRSGGNEQNPRKEFCNQLSGVSNSQFNFIQLFRYCQQLSHTRALIFFLTFFSLGADETVNQVIGYFLALAIIEATTSVK
jgi:hypothetical protein